MVRLPFCHSSYFFHTAVSGTGTLPSQSAPFVEVMILLSQTCKRQPTKGKLSALLPWALIKHVVWILTHTSAVPHHVRHDMVQSVAPSIDFFLPFRSLMRAAYSPRQRPAVAAVSSTRAAPAFAVHAVEH